MGLGHDSMHIRLQDDSIDADFVACERPHARSIRSDKDRRRCHAIKPLEAARGSRIPLVR